MRTDWNKAADWYSDYLHQPGTYQKEVIYPGVLRLLQPQPGKQYVDVACGEGSFAAFLANEARVAVTGIDAAKNLIQRAERLRRNQQQKLKFLVADARNFSRRLHQCFAGATCILALQNIDDYQAVFRETARVLEKNSPFVFVINHPCFRLPRQSGWGWDEGRKLQYRRIDSYFSSYHIRLETHPGRARVPQRRVEAQDDTVSFHRPLQDYVQALDQAGFAITALEEWTSHRQSQPGARAKAENRARHEIPLFMAIRAQYQG